MFTLALVLSPSGSIHPTLSDSSTPARDVAQVLPGESLFVRAFAREEEAREALVVVSRALARLAEVGLLAADCGEGIVDLSVKEEAERPGWVH
jgi:hypothetical protein